MSLEGFLRKAVCTIVRILTGGVAFGVMVGGVTLILCGLFFGITRLLEWLPTSISSVIMIIILALVVIGGLGACHEFGADILRSQNIKFCKK